MIITMIFSTSVFASGNLENMEKVAPNKSNSFSINEYDIITDLQNASDDELIEDGYTKDEIEIIKDFSYEELLYERAQLSEEILREMKYTDEQIKLLRSYDGSNLEDNPQLAASISATCSGWISVDSASTSSITFYADWEWDIQPLLSGYKVQDIAAIRWKGTNSAGSPMNVAISKSNSTGKVTYYEPGVGGSILNKTITVDDNYGKAYCKFPLAQSSSYPYRFAESGYLKIKVDKVGSDPINEISICFSYGHSTVTINPSVSFPASFSINFASTMNKMFSVTNRIKSNGTLI